MAGVYNERPPQPCYTETWCVASVLRYLDGLDNQSIPLGQLAEKLVMLMALARAPRVSTIRLLSIQNMRRQPNGIQFVLTQPNRKQRVGSAPKKFFVPSFARYSSLCPAVCLDEHLSHTSTLRSGTDTGLFISTRLPYQAVSFSTLDRWVKKVLQASGVPSSFTAHSARGASTTAAAISGVTMAEVLAAADWSSQHTSIEHYYRHNSQLFSEAVLSSRDPV